MKNEAQLWFDIYCALTISHPNLFWSILMHHLFLSQQVSQIHAQIYSVYDELQNFALLNVL